MAIRVEHGGKGSDTAGQIIAQAGQGEANRQAAGMRALLQYAASAGQQRGGGGGGGGRGGGGGSNVDERAAQIRELNAKRNMQTEQIQAQAKRDTQAADDATAKTALKFGLDEQIREQEFENTLRMKREEAKVEANAWQVHWSPKQLQQISKLNQSNQAIADKLQRGEIAPEEAEAMTAVVNAAIDNQVPARRPADPNSWKGDPERVPGSGVTWKGEDGSTMTTKLDGTPVVVQRYEQGPEAHAANIKAKEAETQQERKWASEDAANEQHSKRRLEFDKYLREEYDSNQAVAMQDASDAWDKAYPSPARQRQEAEQAAIQQQQAAELQQQRKAELQQYVQEQQSLPWFQREEYAGANLTELDAQLPEQVGLAQARLRKIEQGDVNPNDLPDDMKRQRSADVKMMQQYERWYRKNQRGEIK